MSIQPSTVTYSRIVDSPAVQAASFPPTASRAVDERKTIILGILQIISGTLGSHFGLLLLIDNRAGEFWGVKFVGLGITVWVFTNGIFGILSASYKTSRSLNMVNTIFAIVSIICTFVGFGLFVMMALSKVTSCDSLSDFCYRRETRLAFYVLLLILFVTEWIVSLFVAIYGFRSDLFDCACCIIDQPQVYQGSGEIPGVQMVPTSTQYGQPQTTVQGLAPAYIQTVPQTTMTTTPPKSENCIPPLPPSDTP